MPDRLDRWIVGAALVGAVSACGPTPLPQPPIDRRAVFDLFSMRPDGDLRVRIDGAEGAIEPGSVTVRFHYRPPPNVVLAPQPTETPVDADGTFDIRLPGTVDGTYFVESLEEDRDLFLGAFTGGPDDSVVVVDAGADTDGDGSPDEIDCAPDDPELGGQRCP